MKLKRTSRVFGATPEIIIALVVVESVFQAHEINPVVTSLRDSLHSPKSKHYIGAAVDIRMRYIHESDRQVLITNEIREALTSEYDVVLEGVGTDNVHLHIEFDPTLGTYQSTT